MKVDAGHHDRVIGAACLVACPAISGLFLGLVATLCVYPTAGRHALTVGLLVGCGGFVANAFAIVLTASALNSHAQRRARRAPTAVLELVGPKG